MLADFGFSCLDYSVQLQLHFPMEFDFAVDLIFFVFFVVVSQNAVPSIPIFKPSMSAPDWLVAVQNYMKALQYP